MNADVDSNTCVCPTCGLVHSSAILLIVILSLNLVVLVLCDVRRRRVVMAIPNQDIIGAYYSTDQEQWRQQNEPSNARHGTPPLAV